jgi:tetratricopeptide (TPR) repeat protein
MAETNQPEYIPVDTPGLVDFLKESITEILGNVLDPQTPTFLPNSEILGDIDYQTLQAVIRDLLRHQQELEPQLKANLEFIRGRECYSRDEIKDALAHYQKTLIFWQPKESKSKSKGSPEHSVPQTTLEWLVILFFHIGLCHYRLGVLEPTQETLIHWKDAKQYFQQCLDICQEAGREDLVSKFINQQGEVLQHLSLWEDLQSLAQKALNLHITYGSESQLAQDYGFLAEAAMHNSKWAHASQLAELALAIQTQAQLEETDSQSSYAILVAESRQEFHQWQSTVKELEDALAKTDPKQELQIYLQILKALQKLYFDQDEYREAFRIYQKERMIKYQYGRNSFIGISPLSPVVINKSSSATIALEIEDSGRRSDVDALVERVKDPQKKLTVLHGESGVGKTSLLQAGLIPLLSQSSGVTQTPLVMVTVSNYRDWVRDIYRQLKRTSSTPEVPEGGNFLSVKDVETTIQELTHQNYVIILIFDQFEDFFLGRNRSTRRLFYDFFEFCLQQDSLKLLLSIRSDALHYLLECERCTNLDSINNDLLSKEIRYYLGNLQFSNARNLMEKLTHRTKFVLDPELLDRVMMELWDEMDTVTPIALQMLGYQLQKSGITTIDNYQKLGESPKRVLIKNFFDDVINNCGKLNERTARLVLFLLTNENGSRVMKTRDELAVDLAGEANKLDLVLDILSEAGIIYVIPSLPFDYYQISHDYLAIVLRNQQGEMLITELEWQRERVQRKLSEEKPYSFLDRAIASFFRWMRAD